ncbi:hypothetical protein VD0002_g1375 [Verticillium dahliae]|uniref:BTB domain-containing protein n=1 Tax=Verticillium dahliae TaxID=27337 RepID=A0A444RS49_VERDA|nr:hypothetical protein VD0004_g1668 [Verticillium dahliae]PNH68807.1 hypothetical protein VD0002_g1375 [Verticillium dahliae]RXG44000.1 hypothetical protein VDGE_03624 [Verticillium dahliae]
MYMFIRANTLRARLTSPKMVRITSKDGISFEADRSVLLRSEWFSKAYDGSFKEAVTDEWDFSKNPHATYIVLCAYIEYLEKGKISQGQRLAARQRGRDFADYIGDAGFAKALG